MAPQKLDTNQIVFMYVTDKLSTLEIAKKLGCSVYAVKDNLKRAGTVMRASSGLRTEKAIGFVPTKEFMISAMSYFNNVASDAAKHYGVKYATWIDWLERFDIPRQRPGEVLRGLPSHRRHEIPVEEAAALSNNGTTYEELAQRYGVSLGVVQRRMQQAGHRAPWRRAKDPRFRNVQSKKRLVLHELNITSCEICGESRSLDFCHIKPAALGGPIEPANCLVLCPTHHRLYDSGSLSSQEIAKIQSKIALAQNFYGGW